MIYLTTAYEIVGVVALAMGGTALLILVRGESERHPLRDKIFTTAAMLLVPLLFSWAIASGAHKDDIRRANTLDRAVAAQKEIFERYGAYTPSVLDLTIVDPTLKDATDEGSFNELSIDAAPVSERVVVSSGGISETLEGPVFTGESDPPSEDQLTALAAS